MHSGSSGFNCPEQSVTVQLQMLPSHSKYLFFTLCCRNGLEAIQEPKVILTDILRTKLATYNPNVDPNPPTIDGVGGGAVVLCCAMRDLGDTWTIVQCGSRCSGYLVGHRKQPDRILYRPIDTEIKNLIRGPLRSSF